MHILCSTGKGAVLLGLPDRTDRFTKGEKQHYKHTPRKETDKCTTDTGSKAKNG